MNLISIPTFSQFTCLTDSVLFFFLFFIIIHGLRPFVREQCSVQGNCFSSV